MPIVDGIVMTPWKIILLICQVTPERGEGSFQEESHEPCKSNQKERELMYRAMFVILSMVWHVEDYSRHEWREYIHTKQITWLLFLWVLEYDRVFSFIRLFKSSYISFMMTQNDYCLRQRETTDSNEDDKQVIEILCKKYNQKSRLVGWLSFMSFIAPRIANSLVCCLTSLKSLFYTFHACNEGDILHFALLFNTLSVYGFKESRYTWMPVLRKEVDNE